jgi:D-aminopeptidase
MSSGSGDYVIAFATRRRPAADSLPTEDALSPLFQAAIESTEEAIYNSLLRAVTVQGYRGTIPALPLDSTRAVLRRHGASRP